MTAQHHYISQFHLKQFTDPDSLSLKDPWLWIGSVSEGVVYRRAPKKVATKRELFDHPGCFADRDRSVECFLANEVEGPASVAMREMCSRAPGSGGDIRPELSRYLAWAAARSLPMQTLFADWASTYRGLKDAVLAESPPDGLLQAKEIHEDHALAHAVHGKQVFPASSDFDALVADGWYPDPTDPATFAQMVHVQAYYFQVRFFPRLKWFMLHAPPEDFFVIADRAVGWVADTVINAPPSALRDPSAYVLAPLSRNLVLVGRHDDSPWSVTPQQVNAVVACWSSEWIAGPTESTVAAALEARRRAFAEGEIQ